MTSLLDAYRWVMASLPTGRAVTIEHATSHVRAS